MVVASLLSLLDFMLTRQEARGKKEEKRIFFPAPNAFTRCPPRTCGKGSSFSSHTPAGIARPVPLRNAHFKAGLKVMCFQPAYSFISFFLGGIRCRANACHQQPYCSSTQAHTHKHTRTHTVGLLLLLVSLSCFQVHSHLTPPPTHPPTQPFPPAISLIHAVSPLALPCFSPFSPFWSVRQLEIQFFFPPSLSLLTVGLGWVGGGGWSGANQKLWNRGWSSIGAGNHEPARPSVARCEKEFWIWIRPKQLDVTFIHTTRTTAKIGERTEPFKGSLREGI